MAIPAMLGSYPIERELGRGGMGVVYLARDPRLNRQVAIKIVPDALAGNPDNMARFEREARLLAAVNHPNIASIYGVEDVNGQRLAIRGPDRPRGVGASKSDGAAESGQRRTAPRLQARVGSGGLPLHGLDARRHGRCDPEH